MTIRTKHYSIRTEEAYVQHSNCAGVTGASKRQHNHDLHTCFETRRQRSNKPGRQTFTLTLLDIFMTDKQFYYLR